ncbi:MAG: transmembrane electron transporter [Desulfurococcaceae archaeon]
MESVDLIALIGLAVTWALIDSFDPCIFALFATLLASSMLVDTKQALRVGAAFIASTYIGYVLFGLLLRIAVLRAPIKLLALLLYAYGLFALASALFSAKREEVVCREDDVTCKLANRLRLTKFASGVLPAAVLGIVASFTLMPCSAGLYILYNIVTRQYSYALWIPLTLLYVAVFVLPLVLILLAFFGLSKRSNIYVALLKYEGLIKLAGSLIMLSAATYMVLSTPSI